MTCHNCPAQRMAHYLKVEINELVAHGHIPSYVASRIDAAWEQYGGDEDAKTKAEEIRREKLCPVSGVCHGSGTTRISSN